jgi:hypothetical protein
MVKRTMKIASWVKGWEYLKAGKNGAEGSLNQYGDTALDRNRRRAA